MLGAYIQPPQQALGFMLRLDVILATTVIVVFLGWYLVTKGPDFWERIAG